jgi:apolipoprotein N-acyltransferase
VAAGLLLDTLAIPPGPVPAAVLLADLPFLLLLFDDGGRRWKRWAFLYGVLHFGLALRWLGEVHWVQPLLAAVVLGPVYLLAGGAIRFAVRSRVRIAYAAPAILVLEEYLRTFWMGGMPWPVRSLSFAGHEALAASTAVAGAYALSFVAALTSSLLVGSPLLSGTAAGRSRLVWALSLLVPGGFLLSYGLYGQSRIDRWDAKVAAGGAVETKPLVAIQGNIPQSFKMAAVGGGEGGEANELFQRHVRLSKEALASEAARGSEPVAVLWPETMIPWDLLSPDLAEEFPGEWENELRILSHLPGIRPEETRPLLLLGAIHRFRRGDERHPTLDGYGTHDSLLLIDPARLPGPEEPFAAPRPDQPHWPPWILARHDKVQLVPGGEYMPLGEWLPPLRAIHAAISPIPVLDRGAEDQPPMELPAEGGKVLPVGTAICFELVFPARCRSWRARGALALLNAANYGWFGPTGFREQVVALARLRAAESGLAVVMAGNTGPTLFVDPVGRVHGTFAEAGGKPHCVDAVQTTFREGWAVAPLQGDPEPPPYVRFGDLLWLALGFAVALGALGNRALRRLPKPGPPWAG